MKTWVGILLIVVALGLGAAGGYWFGHARPRSEDNEAAKPEEKPTATVQTVAVRRGPISREITAYGTVIAPPSEMRVVSVPFECRVTKVLVTPGEPVNAGAALVEVSGSSATALAFEEATSAADAANRDLQSVKQRYGEKLATQTELNAAQSAARLAQNRLANLQQAGAGGPREMKAQAAGIVNKVDVQIGQVIPIGGPLVEVVAKNQIQAKLGVEPAEAASLKPGQAVALQRIDNSQAKPVRGQIRLIGQRVDPASRLVDVLVSLPADAGLALDGFVIGKISQTPVDALIVPRETVLPGDNGTYTLFTVKDGQAAKHDVRIGVENDELVQILSDDVKEGDSVVVVGNFTLEDGMKVTAQAATQPTTPETQEAQSSQTQPSPSSTPANAEGASK